MKRSTLVVSTLCILLASCSSNTPSNKEKNLLGDSILEDKTLGEDVPSWTKFEGIKDGRLYTTGYSEMSANKPEYHISKAALMDAEVKLISDAPSDFRVITQNAMTGAGIDSSEYMQIQTKLQEVIGATGFKSHESTCRKIIRHGESQSQVMKACWQQASVNISDLKRAYQLTLEKKYGATKASRFENLMDKELERINAPKRFTASQDQQ